MKISPIISVYYTNNKKGGDTLSEHKKNKSRGDDNCLQRRKGDKQLANKGRYF